MQKEYSIKLNNLIYHKIKQIHKKIEVHVKYGLHKYADDVKISDIYTKCERGSTGRGFTFVVYMQ